MSKYLIFTVILFILFNCGKILDSETTADNINYSNVIVQTGMFGTLVDNSKYVIPVPEGYDWIGTLFFYADNKWIPLDNSNKYFINNTIEFNCDHDVFVDVQYKIFLVKL